MKLEDVRRLEPEEIRALKIGDKVWFCNLLVIPNGWDGDLMQGTIKKIIGPSQGQRPLIAVDMLSSEHGVKCFIIDVWQVSPENIFKEK